MLPHSRAIENRAINVFIKGVTIKTKNLFGELFDVHVQRSVLFYFTVTYLNMTIFQEHVQLESGHTNLVISNAPFFLPQSNFLGFTCVIY